MKKLAKTLATLTVASALVLTAPLAANAAYSYKTFTTTSLDHCLKVEKAKGKSTTVHRSCAPVYSATTGRWTGEYSVTFRK